MTQIASSNSRIARTALLDQIEHALLQYAAEAEDAAPIINIYGIRGIGKTELLRQAFRHFHDRYAVVLLDFGAADHPQEGAVPWSAASAILRQIPALKSLPATIEPSQTSGSLFDKPLIVCETALARIEDRPLLLLLDTLDDLPFWKWLQQELIKPLLAQPSAIVLCASQSPLFWHFWELREHCAPLQLYAFSKEETLAFLANYDRELLATTIYELTLGYPLVIERIMMRLDDEPNDTDASASLSGLTPPTRELMEYIGMLRRADVPTIELLLSESHPLWRNGAGDRNAIHQAITELALHDYFAPYRRERRPYQFRRSLRRASERAIQQITPDRYRESCTFLALFYYDRSCKGPITEIHSFVEWLHFSAGLLARGEGDTLDQWHDKLGQLFASQNLAIAALIALFHSDSEVMQDLRSIGQLDYVQACMAEYIGQSAITIPIQIEFDFSRGDILEPLIDQVAQTIPLLGIQKYFDEVLRAIARAGDEFDIPWLRERIATTGRLSEVVSPRQIEEAMILLNRRGLLAYDRGQRTYRPDPLIKTLVTSPTAHRDLQTYWLGLVRNAEPTSVR